MNTVVEVFRAIVGEERVKELLLSEEGLIKEDEQFVAKVRANRHLGFVSKALSTIKELPEAEVGDLKLQEECKELWEFVRESGNLELDGTPMKALVVAKEKRQKQEGKIFCVPSISFDLL